MFEFQIQSNEKGTIVAFKGDMDIDITEVVHEEIIPTLQNYNQVEINFSEVSFVDSTGIGLLITLVEQLKQREILISITQLSSQVRDVFDLLQIPDILGHEIFLDTHENIK